MGSRERQEVAHRGGVVAERAAERIGRRRRAGGERDRGVAARAGERPAGQVPGARDEAVGPRSGEAASRALGERAPSRRSRAGRTRHECRARFAWAPIAGILVTRMTPVVPARPLLVAIVLAALAGGGDRDRGRAGQRPPGPSGRCGPSSAPAVGWSFIGTGLYAWRRRPESRIGALMILLGFAWFSTPCRRRTRALVYTVALVVGGLWGARLPAPRRELPDGPADRPRRHRTLAIAGYFVFPLAFVPALLFAGPHDLGCDDCPTNLLLVRRDADLATVLTGLGALLLPRALRHRARLGDAALAGDAADRAPAAHAGLHLLAAHLPARDRGPRRRRATRRGGRRSSRRA